MNEPVSKFCSCGSAELSVFLRLGDLPLSDGLLTEEALSEEEARYPLDVAVCNYCSLVQILDTVPAEKLCCRSYPHYSSLAETLAEHSKRNAHRLIADRMLDAKTLVVELASNNGHLLQYFAEFGIPVLGIDPAAGPAVAATREIIPVHKSCFSKELALRLRSKGQWAEVILANGVLDRVPDPDSVVEGIRLLLKRNGIAVIEVPYVKDLVDNCEFDAICHERLRYFSVASLIELFSRHGLSLNHVEHYPIHGGSLRLFVERHQRVQESVHNYLEIEVASQLREPIYYRTFSARVLGIRMGLGRLIRELKAEGKRIAAYGAVEQGTILLNYIGLGCDLIDFVVDRNVHKQGKFMAGVHLPICAPERILDEMPDYVLLLPWNSKDQILAQQAEYQRRGGRFIIPIPKPELVSLEAPSAELVCI